MEYVSVVPNKPNIAPIETSNIVEFTGKIFEIKATESKADAKRLIEGKAVKINNEIIADINHFVNNKNPFELSVGKKKFFKIIIK